MNTFQGLGKLLGEYIIDVYKNGRLVPLYVGYLSPSVINVNFCLNKMLKSTWTCVIICPHLGSQAGQLLIRSHPKEASK